MPRQIGTVDMHTGGEPLRIVVSGGPEPLGRTVLERRRWLKENADEVRTALMWEPRGHADMYGCIIVPPEREDSDFGAIFMHNEGYSTMCGHATLALARYAVDEGLAKSSERIAIDVPAGQVLARAEYANGGYKSSSFRNVGSFVLEQEASVDVDGIGGITYAVVFGGAFYALVDANSLGFDIVPSESSRLIDLGRRIKSAVRARGEPQHPVEPDLSFLYGVIFTGRPKEPHNHSRNVCVFADGEVDRSPTGSGVSGRIALHVSRNEVQIGQTVTIESIVGSTMSVCAVEESVVGGYRAVVPEVGGFSYYTGRSTFVIEDEDPFKDGFLVR